MDIALAIEILGVRFSGTQAAIVAVVVMVVVVGGWLLLSRRPR